MYKMSKHKSDLMPMQVVRDIGKHYPGVWQDVKKIRSSKGKDLPDWPDWCYIPIAAGIAITTGGDDSNLLRATFDKYSPAVVTAAAAWRITQGIYKFDADIYNELTGQPMSDNLPCDALKRLPEWCVYIETIPAKSDHYIVGFWCHLEKDQNDGREELRFVFFWNTGDITILPVHLGPWTLKEGLQKTIDEAKRQAKKQGVDLAEDVDDVSDVGRYLQLVLYLCADNADIPDSPEHPSKRVRLSGQVDVARKPRTWDVGVRIGSAIRGYRNKQSTPRGGTHQSPRPHVRRAHYHHFWSGPRDGDRKLILHWIPPVPVNIDPDAETPAVIHKVKKE